MVTCNRKSLLDEVRLHLASGMLTRCEVAVDEQAFPKSSASPGLSGTFLAMSPEWQWQYYKECWIEYFCAQLVTSAVLLVVLTVCYFSASLQNTGFSHISQTQWRNVWDKKIILYSPDITQGWSENTSETSCPVLFSDMIIWNLDHLYSAEHREANSRIQRFHQWYTTGKNGS